MTKKEFIEKQLESPSQEFIKQFNEYLIISEIMREEGENEENIGSSRYAE